MENPNFGLLPFPWATYLNSGFLGSVETALRIAYHLIWNWARFLSQGYWPSWLLVPFLMMKLFPKSASPKTVLLTPNYKSG